MHCRSCGASLPADESSSSCEYCGSTIIQDPDKNKFSAAEAFRNAGAYDEAYRLYSEIIQVNPRAAYAWYGRGLCTPHLGSLADMKTEEMVGHFRRAIDVAPENVKGLLRTDCALSTLISAKAWFEASLDHMMKFVGARDIFIEHGERAARLCLAAEQAHEWDNDLEEAPAFIYEVASRCVKISWLPSDEKQYFIGAMARYKASKGSPTEQDDKSSWEGALILVLIVAVYFGLQHFLGPLNKFWAGVSAFILSALLYGLASAALRSSTSKQKGAP